VISRISATMLDPTALGTLRDRAHETLDELTGEVCEHAGVAREEVYEIVVTGNVTMMQIALGIDPEPLSMAPFIITARKLPPARAADFGVAVHPRAPAVVFAALGAYVGGDIVAGLLASLPDGVYPSQRAVRGLRFAKASTATGWTILLRELGVEVRDLAQVLLAGSFGSYLSPASAVRIGLVPKMALTRIVSAGN